MIVFARRWAVLPCTNLFRQAEPRMVMAPCAHPQRRLFCTTCDTPLANAGQLAMHEEKHPEVEHTIVEWCDRHHTYELANPIALPKPLAQPLPPFFPEST